MITLVEGARIEVRLDDAPCGTGVRRFTVNEIGTRWVKLFYQPQAMEFRVLKADLERNPSLKVVTASRGLGRMIKETVAEREGFGYRVSANGAATALAHLKEGRTSAAKAVSRDLTIKALTAADWTRVRGNGLVRTIDGHTFAVKKAGDDFIGLMDDAEVAKGKTEEAVKRALLKRHRDGDKPADAPTDGRSKREIVAGLLTRREGCTTQDILAATGWPAVSVPQQARASGLVLKTEKLKGQPTRYWASRPE